MNKETIILHAFITKCYTEYGSFIKNYISYRIPHKYEAETIKSGIENTEQTILANELAALINSRMKHLPDKRRTTYHLSLYDGLSVSEIAERLHISYRTAECHLFLARKDMRHFITYFWAC